MDILLLLTAVLYYSTGTLPEGVVALSTHQVFGAVAGERWRTCRKLRLVNLGIFLIFVSLYYFVYFIFIFISCCYLGVVVFVLAGSL